MKKSFTLFLMIVVAVALSAAPAQAKDWGNGEKNVGYVVTRPFVAVGHAMEAVGNLFKGKPGKLLLLPDTVRKDAFDTVEGVARTAGNVKALNEDERGLANTKITDAGLDPLVDGVLYGAFGGLMANGYLSFGEQQVVYSSLIGIGSGATVVGMDAAGEALDQDTAPKVAHHKAAHSKVAHNEAAQKK